MKSRFYWVFPLLVAAASGCTNPNTPAAVSGKITYNSSPVTGGTMTFQLAKEGPVYPHAINVDGTYSISDLPPGDYIITIETESINPDRPKQPIYGPPDGQKAAGPDPATPPTGTMPPGAASTAPVGTYLKIDPKYKDPKTSGLTVTVTGGSRQTKDLPLTGP